MPKWHNLFKKPPCPTTMEALAEWCRDHLPEDQRRDLADWFAREYPGFDAEQFLKRAGVQQDNV